MEYEILSGRGRVMLKSGDKTLIIPPYPKLIHPPTEFDTEYIAEYKWNGYNVRTLMFDNEIISLLRGGKPDEHTKELILEYYGDKIQKFFADNPNLVLCGEVVGSKTMAGFKGIEFAYLIFDIMDLNKPEDERFMPYKEKIEILRKYRLDYVGMLGVFDDYERILKLLKDMPSEDKGVEGVVLKSIDGNTIFKLRYDMHPDMFGDKIVNKHRERVEKTEERIFRHFMQGYGEEELGLHRGMNKEEFDKLESMLEQLYTADKSEISKIGNKIKEFLFTTLMKCGEFNEEMQSKLKKQIKSYVGRRIGKIMKKRREYIG